MAKQGHFEEHWLDENGNPAGGVSTTRRRDDLMAEWSFGAHRNG